MIGLTKQELENIHKYTVVAVNDKIYVEKIKKSP